jgi:hypothetical protein
MSSEHQITRKAADGTLTMADLREFLDEFDKAASTAGRPALGNGYGVKPAARIAFGGGIKSISVTIPGGEAEQR